MVLHDALGLPFDQVAQVLDVTTEAARQHAVRGRRRLHEAALPPPAQVAEQQRVLGDLQQALLAGDPDRIASMLAPDVVLVADHAGRVTAAGRAPGQWTAEPCSVDAPPSGYGGSGSFP